MSLFSLPSPGLAMSGHFKFTLLHKRWLYLRVAALAYVSLLRARDWTWIFLLSRSLHEQAIYRASGVTLLPLRPDRDGISRTFYANVRWSRLPGPGRRKLWRTTDQTQTGGPGRGGGRAPGALPTSKSSCPATLADSCSVRRLCGNFKFKSQVKFTGESRPGQIALAEVTEAGTRSR